MKGMNCIMIIGILKESDGRAVIVPSDIPNLLKSNKVLFEKGLGSKIGYSDSEYVAKGAVCKSKEEIWESSDVLIKYKAPTEEDYRYFKKDKVFMGLMHPEGNPRLLEEFNNSRMTTYSFEYFRTESGIFPLGAAGGEIAGNMAVMYANHFLQSHYGGTGRSLFGVSGVEPTKVLVIGAGHVGLSTVRALLRLGNEVFVTARDYDRLKKLSIAFGTSRLKVIRLKSTEFYSILKEVDAIFGAILISTDETPAVLTGKDISKMKKGSIVVDITSGYGRGYLPSLNRKTSLLNPVNKTETGQLYIKIDNLPSAYPRTSSDAYSHQLCQYIDEILTHISEKEINYFVESGKITSNGNIVHQGVRHDLEYIGVESDCD